MKKILCLFVALMMVSANAFGITWTKSWSSSDDGSPLSGSDIENIQNDVNSQVPTLTGNNVLSGNNTFSGTTTFSGTISGITGSAAHAITKGFELVWNSTTVVTINPGTLFHNTTAVTKTATSTLDITAAGDAIDGAAVQGVSKWVYVYVDSSGNLKLYSTAPDKADTAGNTAGTKIYYYYVATTTYYRCIGAIRLNATGAGEIEVFYQTGNYTEWATPAQVTTTASDGAWSGAISCAASIPAISRKGQFYIGFYVANQVATLSIRPNGATGITPSNTTGNLRGYYTVGGSVTSMTDTSQQIQHYENKGGGAISDFYIHTLGYYSEIR